MAAKLRNAATRPAPPADLLDPLSVPMFTPAPDLATWAHDTFVAETATLMNPDHTHLRWADIGMLWTNVANSRQGRGIVGQAELGTPRAMGKWAKARAEQQVREWFGEEPDFILTFDASYAGQCSDAEFCALVEHELYHCGQDRDEFGLPKFTKQGRPVFAMRGHDLEQFVGVVRRYGVTDEALQQMVDAAKRGPEVSRVSVSQACGTCQLRSVA